MERFAVDDEVLNTFPHQFLEMVVDRICYETKEMDVALLLTFCRPITQRGESQIVVLPFSMVFDHPRTKTAQTIEQFLCLVQSFQFLTQLTEQISGTIMEQLEAGTRF